MVLRIEFACSRSSALQVASVSPHAAWAHCGPCSLGSGHSQEHSDRASAIACSPRRKVSISPSRQSPRNRRSIRIVVTVALCVLVGLTANSAFMNSHECNSNNAAARVSDANGNNHVRWTTTGHRLAAGCAPRDWRARRACAMADAVGWAGWGSCRRRRVRRRRRASSGAFTSNVLIMHEKCVSLQLFKCVLCLLWGGQSLLATPHLSGGVVSGSSCSQE